MIPSKVMSKFVITSLLMWSAPLAILYGFKKELFPGVGKLSPEWHTLLSGFIAVISVNVVIVFYIILAFKEPSSSKHQPDPTFLAQAQESLRKYASEESDTPADAKKDN